jgi:hypothetical protein
MTVTQTKYASFQRAYDVFNVELFQGALPQVLITLQRKSRTLGYFSPDRFAGITDGHKDETIHELAMNPVHFGRGDLDTLGTLAHEMCHVWQQACGTPPRRCYHDKEWAAKMEEIGLMPSDTAEAGGKRTGQKVSHYILAGGRFKAVAEKLLKAGFRLEYASRESEGAGGSGGEKKPSSKTKFTCGGCSQNAWAKPGARLICGDCEEEMEAEG